MDQTKTNTQLTVPYISRSLVKNIIFLLLRNCYIDMNRVKRKAPFSRNLHSAKFEKKKYKNSQIYEYFEAIYSQML